MNNPQGRPRSGYRDRFAIEREVREFLLAAAPNVKFLGEEGGTYGQSSVDLMWALDPVDGTANYVRGLPLSAVSLGLIDGKDSVLGVVDVPFLGHRYSAIRGSGVHRGTKPCRRHTTEAIADAVVALGDYAVGEDAAGKNVERLRTTQSSRK